jgi:hypothetical protein
MSRDPRRTDAKPNALEHALARAADDPEYFPEFFRLLMESRVYVVGEMEDGDDGRRSGGATMLLAGVTGADGEDAIPFFSSLAMLRRAMDDPRPYVHLPVRVLFETTKGMRLVLNPFSPMPRLFLPAEVRHLLAGTEPPQVTVQQVLLQKGTAVDLTEPDDAAREAGRVLVPVLATIPEVRAAYVARAEFPHEPGERYLVVGIDAGPAYRRALAKLYEHVEVLASLPAETGFLALDGESNLARHLASMKPFYRRGWVAGVRHRLGGPRRGGG